MIPKYKDYIKTTDIRNFEKLSKQIDDSEMSIYIQQSMVEELEYILSSNLYDTIMSLYSQSLTLVSISVGANTILEVSDASLIDTNYIIQVSNILGTISPINDIDLTVTNVTGNLITVNFDSTGLVYDGGGVVQNISSSLIYGLRQFIIPFLSYSSFARYTYKSNQSSTSYGNVQKTNQYSTITPDAKLGANMNITRDSKSYWKDRLVNELDTNKYNEIGYVSNYIELNTDNTMIPIYPKKRRLLGLLQNRRFT